jgi:hypothetical protein
VRCVRGVLDDQVLLHDWCLHCKQQVAMDVQADTDSKLSSSSSSNTLPQMLVVITRRLLLPFEVRTTRHDTAIPPPLPTPFAIFLP